MKRILSWGWCVLVACCVTGGRGQDVRISELPRTNKVAGAPDLLVLQAMGGGANTNTWTITLNNLLSNAVLHGAINISNLTAVSAVLSNAFLHGTALLTNLSPQTLGANTNLPMTYSNTAYLTRFASLTNQGIISSNGFAALNITPGEAGGMFRTPHMGMFTFNDVGGAATEAYYQQNADSGNTNGYVDLGYRIIMIADGWQAFTRTNGHLHADPAKFPTSSGLNGMTNLVNYIHSNRCLAGIYTESSQFSSLGDGRPGSLGFYETDAQDFANWGIDFIEFDVPIGGQVEGAKDRWTYQVRSFVAALRAATNRWIAVQSASVMPEGSDTVVSPDVVSALNAFQITLNVTHDSSSNLFWKSFMSDFNRMTPMLHLCRDGLTQGPEFWQMNYPSGHAIYNATRASGGMHAILNSFFFTHKFYLPAVEPDVYATLTNRFLLDILKDPISLPGFMAQSNSSGQVWCRKLSDGRLAVGMLNPSTNAAATIGFTWTQIGLKDSQTATLYEIWQKTNVVATGSYTSSVPACHASIFMVTPQDAFATYPTGNALDYFRVNAGNTGVEFARNPFQTNTVKDTTTTNHLHILSGGASSPSGNANAAFVLHDTANTRSNQMMRIGFNSTTDYQIFRNPNSSGLEIFGTQAGLNFVNIWGDGTKGLLVGTRVDSPPQTGILLETVGNSAATQTNFANYLSVTNGLASFATNIVLSANAAGYTNSPIAPGTGVGVNVAANIIGTSGTYVFYNRSGAGGATVCGTSLFTNTIPTLGQTLPVPVNCGIQVVTGAGVTIQVYAQ